MNKFWHGFNFAVGRNFWFRVDLFSKLSLSWKISFGFKSANAVFGMNDNCLNWKKTFFLIIKKKNSNCWFSRISWNLLPNLFSAWDNTSKKRESHAKNLAHKIEAYLFGHNFFSLGSYKIRAGHLFGLKSNHKYSSLEICKGARSRKVTVLRLLLSILDFRFIQG